MTEVGIVATLLCKSAIVLVGDVLLVKILLDKLLQSEACMVRCQTNNLYIHNL